MFPKNEKTKSKEISDQELRFKNQAMNRQRNKFNKKINKCLLTKVRWAIKINPQLCIPRERASWITLKKPNLRDLKIESNLYSRSSRRKNHQ
jgi:hypothetical protein